MLISYCDPGLSASKVVFGIVLNNEPTCEITLVISFVSFAVKVALPDWSLKIASTDQTDGTVLRPLAISSPKLADIFSRLDPRYTVCQTTPTLDLSIVLASFDDLGIA